MRREAPLDILHLAAHCCNVPVTFTLDRTMSMLAVIGAGAAGFAILALLIALVAKFAIRRLYFPAVSWGDLTPRKALERRKERASAVLAVLAYLYALSQWAGATLFFGGLVLFLAGYLPWRFGS